MHSYIVLWSVYYSMWPYLHVILCISEFTWDSQISHDKCLKEIFIRLWCINYTETMHRTRISHEILCTFETLSYWIISILFCHSLPCRIWPDCHCQSSWADQSFCVNVVNVAKFIRVFCTFVQTNPSEKRKSTAHYGIVDISWCLYTQHLRYTVFAKHKQQLIRLSFKTDKKYAHKNTF